MPNKIYIAGRNQTKTVTPSNVQQTIEADTGYNALDSVVVNPIKAAMPQTIEQFIMRDDNMEPFSLNLDGAIPDYACYRQRKLVAVYGTPTIIGTYAFDSCTSLSAIDCPSVITINQYAFNECSVMQKVDVRNVINLGYAAFYSCSALQAIDCRNAATFSSFVFRGCNGLFLIDITNTHNATLDATNALPSNANLTILAADATDKAYYQSATNWSTYASKIKTVAEFEVEIGMTYDEYYLQVFGHPRNEALT